MTGRFEYRADDVTCEAYVAEPAAPAGRRPAVLVGHQWGGQSDHERGKADELAGLGYVGIAIDVYGKGVRGDPAADNSALMGPFMADRALLLRRLMAAVEAAKTLASVDPDRVAMIGYCFGGLCGLDLARSGTADIRGIVSIHGIFPPPNPGKQGPIRAKVLLLHGWNDPYAPPDDVQAVAKELTEAGADWQLHAYGHALHAFTAEGLDLPERGLRYDANAARRSWAATVGFLAEVLA